MSAPVVVRTPVALVTTRMPLLPAAVPAVTLVAVTLAVTCDVPPLSMDAVSAVPGVPEGVPVGARRPIGRPGDVPYTASRQGRCAEHAGESKRGE